MLDSLAAVTAESFNLTVDTTPSLIYSESNLPSTSPFVVILVIVTSFVESISPVLIIESLLIAMPVPAL